MYILIEMYIIVKISKLWDMMIMIRVMCYVYYIYIFMTIYYQLSGVITLKTLALFELGSFNMGGTPLNMLQGHGCPLNLELKEFLRKFCSIKKHTKNQKE